MADDSLSITTVPLGTMTLTMNAPLLLEHTPVGTRVIVEFATIEWTGDRLRASKKGTAAGDWLTIGPDGIGVLDARFVLETDDGAVIYVHGPGRNDAANFQKGGVNYFLFCFETGAPRYAWLNRVVAVAKGRLQPGGGTVRFEVLELR